MKNIAALFLVFTTILLFNEITAMSNAWVNFGYRRTHRYRARCTTQIKHFCRTFKHRKVTKQWCIRTYEASTKVMQMALSISSSGSEQAREKRVAEDPNRERGLMYVIDKLERGGKISCDDMRMFLNDLSLPQLTNEMVAKKFRDAGVPQQGISSIANFFVFIMSELKHHDSDDIISAFKTFDHETTGFIDATDLREIVGHLGDILEMEEIDRVIEMSDVDGDGTINYEEVLKLVHANEGHLDAAGVPLSHGTTPAAGGEESDIMEKLAGGGLF